MVDGGGSGSGLLGEGDSRGSEEEERKNFYVEERSFGTLPILASYSSSLRRRRSLLLKKKKKNLIFINC